MTALVVKSEQHNISSLTEASEGARLAQGVHLREDAAFAVSEFDPETTATPPDNILRWEDDGGTALSVCDPRLQRQDLHAEGSARG